jgi:acetylornithine deacetylase/succinyl-diaminopimelate desuccinylase-like protein
LNQTETLVDLLGTFIRNRCVNDGTPDSGHEHRSVQTLAEFFGASGTVFEPHPGRQSVLYRVAGRNPSAPTLMLMGHLDVVPADEKGWEHDPFGGEVHDGFVWGRGAVDMLNVTTTMAAVFKRYLDGQVPRPEGDLLYLAVADEEAGATRGAGYLTEHHWNEIRCDFVLNEVAYPALHLSDPPAFPVNVGEKGPYWRSLEAMGTPGHGSQPYGTDNALIPLARAMAGLAEAPSPVVISDEWRLFVEGLGFPEQQAADWLDPERIDQVIEDLAAESLGMARYVHACTHLTVSPNVLESGVKANVIPEYAKAEVDFRAVPGQDASTVDDHLAKVLADDRDLISIEPVLDHEASSSASRGPLWEAIVDAFGTLADSRRVVPTLTPVSTDLRFFRDRGAVAYGVGWYDDRIEFPEFLSMFHGRNERVSVESLRRTYELLDKTVERFFARVGP